MKEKFIKKALILALGGFITKILSMVIRIITTRVIGVDGLGLYMLVLPTFNLFITIATLSLPTAISKLVAEGTRNNKKLVLGFLPIAIIFNIFLIIIIIILAPFIANNLLHNEILYYPIISIGITLPFITTSSIIKGYFFGKEKMFPNVVSNMIEQIIRIISIIFIIPYLLKINISYAVSGLVFINCLSESLGIITLLLFMPNKTKISKNDIKPDLNNIKDIFSISIPTTTSRLISSIGLFLEPIIITFVFLKLGYQTTYITKEYGIISGYVLPMVMMPNFLSGAISNALLPTVTKSYANKKYKETKRKLLLACNLSLIIGAIFTIILFIFPKECLKLLFNTTLGSNYLKITSIIFLISYILNPLSICMQAMDKSKELMKINIIAVIIKTSLLFTLTYLNINMWPLIISYGIQYIYITIKIINIIRKNL